MEGEFAMLDNVVCFLSGGYFGGHSKFIERLFAFKGRIFRGKAQVGLIPSRQDR